MASQIPMFEDAVVVPEEQKQAHEMLFEFQAVASRLDRTPPSDLDNEYWKLLHRYGDLYCRLEGYVEIGIRASTSLEKGVSFVLPARPTTGMERATGSNGDAGSRRATSRESNAGGCGGG